YLCCVGAGCLRPAGWGGILADGRRVAPNDVQMLAGGGWLRLPGASELNPMRRGSMRGLRKGRRGWSSVFVLAALLAAGAVVLSAGPAAASGTVTCPPGNGTDVQNAINGGGTVTINGTCHGNFFVNGGVVASAGGTA